MPPELHNSRTMVPVRKIFETLGAQVSWDGATRTVTATKGDITVKLEIDNPVAHRNGLAIALDQPPIISHDRTLVPLRFSGEALNSKVEWFGESRTVVITPGP